jgi:hypothetical protein
MPFHAQLRTANTVEEVVSAVQQYLHVWGEVLQRLPPECRPVIEGAGDIATAASDLALARKRLVDRGQTVSHELDMTARFFEAAALRLAQLRSV